MYLDCKLFGKDIACSAFDMEQWLTLTGIGLLCTIIERIRCSVLLSCPVLVD